jgi:hypothetical protein
LSGALIGLVMTALLSIMALIEPAAANKDRPDGTISTISDDRITESSGLALSVKHDDLAYTINDSGNHPMVYAIQASTGNVIGTTDISAFDVEDIEAITVDAQGMIWVGDLGDNDRERDDVSIISFPEPGPGDHQLAAADRYGVSFPDGPVDVEALLVHPETGQVHLVSKEFDGSGTVFVLPALTPGATVTAEDTGAEAPRGVSDGTFTHSGRWALLRTNDDVWVYNPSTWKPVSRIETPDLGNAESVTVERGDKTMLLGSEGKDSPIVRVALPDLSDDAPSIKLTDGATRNVGLGTALGFTVTVVLLAGFILVARRRGKV